MKSLIIQEPDWYYNARTVPNVERILNLPTGLLTNLIAQINKLERRKKGG
jgi:hypothetical protein